MKPTKTQYCIKSCPTDDTEQLELLLNTMAAEGWDLYTMQEAEDEDDGYQFNCIFVREMYPEDISKEDFSNYFGFKTKMERIMAPHQEPLDICIDIQKKIKDKRAKISKIKSMLDSTSEDSRKHLNEEMSVNIKELENLKKQLFKMLSPDVMYNKLGEEKLTIALSEELTELINPDSEINLLTKIVEVRQNLTDKLGYVIPEVKPINGDLLQANEFEINIRGTRAVKSTCYPGYVMFFKDELNLPKLPKNTIKEEDPVTGRKIVWIEEEKAKDFWTEGYNSNDYLARILEFVAIKYVDEIFDYSDLNRYIENVAVNNLFLIENIIPDFVSVGELKYLLTNLIKEQVSVKDVVFIFEKLNDLASEPGKEDLLGGLRRLLARKITVSLADESGNINIIEFSDKSLKNLIGEKGSGNVVKIESSKIEKLVKKIEEKAAENCLKTKDTVLVMPTELRQVGFLVFSKFMADIKVAAREEITTDYPSKIIGEI